MKLFSKKIPDDSPARRRSNDRNEPQETPSHSFRRNQTLTGSRSKNVNSSAEMNATMLSPRAQAHHLHTRRRKLGLRLGGIIVVCLAVYVLVGQLIASNSVSISSGNVSTDQINSYDKSIEDYLNARPSERFYPVLNQAALLQSLQVNHPEIRGLDADLTGAPGVTAFVLELRNPVARWSVDGREEFVDETGYVFDVNAYQNPSVEIIDQTGLDPNTSGIVTSNRFLAFVGRVVGAMSLREYTVDQATMPLLTTRQINITLSGIPYPIKMATDRPAGEQVEDATRVITFLQQRNIGAEYIDVRISGKAFYK